MEVRTSTIDGVLVFVPTPHRDDRGLFTRTFDAAIAAEHGVDLGPLAQDSQSRSRAGTIRAPQFTGGGVAFPPTMRSFELKVNKKVKRAAFRAALAAHVNDSTFAVLDAYATAGGNFLDISDSYMWRIPGNSGGESETIIGYWMADRGNRDDIVVATKVGSLPARAGLAGRAVKDQGACVAAGKAASASSKGRLGGGDPASPRRGSTQRAASTPRASISAAVVQRVAAGMTELACATRSGEGTTSSTGGNRRPGSARTARSSANR